MFSGFVSTASDVINGVKNIPNPFRAGNVEEDERHSLIDRIGLI